MSMKDKNDKKVTPENVGAVNTHTHTHTHTGSLSQNKKIIIGVGILVGIMVLLGIFALIFSFNKNKSESLSGSENGYNAGGIVNGDKGYISSAQITQVKTGTGPFDSNDDPGNDSSEDNNIVRSFDQVTWTVNLTMALKQGIAETNLTGGTINVNASLPEECANVMKWDTSSMQWLENGQVSSDGRTLTGQYTMNDQEVTIPGNQSLVFVLQVYGAGNKTEIVPTFTFDLEGNADNEKVTINGEKVIVSATGKYNVQLHDNTGYLSSKTTVDYGEGETSGRMYGYGFTVQLYNDNESKGLKGVEYPKGEISFDIDLKLERSKFGSEELEDITDECTPVLWNYRLNEFSQSNDGLIENRELYGLNVYHKYDPRIPLGKGGESEFATYNSGDLKITQIGNKLKVSITNYDFNGVFPYYTMNDFIAGYDKIYTDNIGAFSIGYIQIFVPDNGASTIQDRNYYLTIADNNIKITTYSDETINTQMKTSDDSIRVNHVLYKQGGYNHDLDLFLRNSRELGSVEKSYGTGDGRICIGNSFTVWTKFIMAITNDNDIYTADKFIKFDGEGFEPIYFSDGTRYKLYLFDGNAKFRIWYVTKKDGTNWTSQEEMNNANIEDMEIYDNIEDIPEGKICIGVYAETTDGYIAKSSGDNNLMYIPLKVKNTATIGKTYGITQRTRMWVDQLDRSIYTVTNKDVEWPTPTWDSGNRQYIKTEYDEDGNMISGTHSGGHQWGNTALVVGANLHGNIRAVDSSNVDKINYDLGKNENVVTYSVEPQLDANSNLSAQITNVTLKAEVTIPAGLTYIPGSCKFGEPEETTNNDDGSTTLVWYIYGVTSGQSITPIKFDANIDNETSNGTQYTAKFVVSEHIGSDGITKIGNSKIDFRTSTVTINITNMENNRLYKEVETPIIEKNGQVKYRVVYSNGTDTALPDFQLLDILPYNGDNRGTNFDGTYNIGSINIKQTISGTVQSNNNLTLYTTNSTTVRNMDAKNTGIGTDSIWSAKTIGANLNENATGFAIKGQLAGRARLEIEITLNTNGNLAENVYANNTMAQINTSSNQLETGTVRAQVVSRKIKGKVWNDSNRNGVIDDGETYASGVTLKLLNGISNAQITTTKTNSNGEYEFNNLDKGTYKVEVVVDDLHELTDKGVGSNIEINSKFNTDTKITDEITRLNNMTAPEMIEENVNAGIKTIQFNIKTRVEGEGGHISGEGEEVYESVDKGQDSKKDIIATPDKGFRVDTITVNGERIEFQEETDHSVILDKFTNMQEDKEVVVTFKDVRTSVLVHHYKENTTEKLSEDVTIDGEIGDSYSTQVASDIPQNYEVVAMPPNANGTMTQEQIVVTYYYNLKDPTIEQSKIDKNSTLAKVTEKDQAVPYTITYSANVDIYIGDAEVTIVDYLPYEIVEESSSLDGGSYDANSKTITWTESITGINTFTNTNNQINITKNISLVYKDLDVTKSNVSNRVTGTINLKTPEKTDTVEDTKDIPTEFLKDLKVTKVWNDNNNSANKRPNSVTLVLNGNGQTYKQSVTIADAVQGNNNNWEYTFRDLPKYDTSGNEIDYQVSEERSAEENNKFYTESIDQGNKTITNTFQVPDEKITVTAKKYWDDNNNSAQKRPASATLTLTGTGAGVNISKEQEVTSANGDANTWEYTFTDLQKYDENGDEVVYTINEKDLNNEFYIKSNVDQETRTVTNKFQVPGDEVDVTITKIWDDNSNRAGKRPPSVTLQVKNGNQVVASETVTEDDAVDGDTNRWSHTFSVPKYDASGNEINYTADEADLSNKFYTVENKAIDGDMTSGYTITNKFVVPDERISIPVTKVWDDNSNSAGKRPESVTLVLTGNGQEYKQELTSKANVDSGNANNWIYTFNDLPKLDENGDEINYVLSEELSNIYYTAENSIVDQNAKTVTNTFKVPDERISVTATKVWDDNSNKANKRPDSVTLTLTGTGTGVNVSKEQKITVSDVVEGNNNNWSYTFDNLQKYDDNGDEIVYTIDEKDLNNKFYVKSNVDQGNKTVTNTFEVPDEKVSIPVTKIWDDNGNSAGKRPESVTLKLTGNGQEYEQKLTASNDTDGDTNTWEYTFTNLPKYDENGDEIVYTLSEEDLENKFYTSENTVVSQEDKTVTNKFVVPDERISVPVTKVWDDNNNSANKRPSSVVLVLTSNDANDGNSPYKYTLTTDNADSQDSNKWAYTFNNLPKYNSNGDEIAYTLSEELDNIYYTSANRNIDQDSKTITNTFKVPTDTVEIPVVKIWNDNSNVASKRPTSIDLVLNGSDGSGPYRQTLTDDNKDLADSNKWTYTFRGLPKYNQNTEDEITYTLSEENVNSNFYVASVDQTSKTVTNTFSVPDEKTQVTAKKYWDDNSNANNRRPTSVTLTLTGKGQGVDISREQELTEADKVDGDINTWKYTFTDLPKYDDYGNEVVYTVNEKDLNNDFYIKSNVDQDTRTITNTFQVPGDRVDVTVTKVWDDNGNSANKRPTSVTLQVKNGEQVVASEPVTVDDAVGGDTNRWSHTFSVPKYDAQGQEINYTADEADLGSIFYTAGNKNIAGDMNSGFTITNKFVVPDERISVPVTKVWDDNENLAGKRPSSVTLVLKGNGQTYKQELTSEINADSSNSNNWKYTFDNLPKYDANGDEINYVLSEELDNIYYTSVNSKVDQESKTITNKFAVPSDTISVPVVKVWNDNENAAGKRPDNVTLVLTGNDENDENNPYKHTLTVDNEDRSDTNRWLYAFTGLPKYNSVNGDEIVYTLSEENLDNKFYTTENTVVSQEDKSVTNTFEVPDERTSVTVTKIWDDKDNLAGKRPASVTMTLTGTGEGVNSSYEQVLTAEANADPSNANHWVYTFNDLPKLDNFGNEIKFTVDEKDLENKFYSKGTVDQTEMTVTNVSEYGKVIVHHYIMDTDGTTTTTRVPSTDGTEIPDQTIEGAQGEEYTTNPAENIQSNYELVAEKLPANASGTIAENDTEVIYYYRLKTPTVTNNVTKSGTDRITSANQEVNYTVNYTANVTDYIGNAEVTIVDTLPYEIDEGKSNLDGGTYDSASKTITWTENVSDLNSYNGKGFVNITKNIKVVYTGLDMNQDKITNNVKAHIKLLTPEKTSDETTNSFDTTIYKAIISAEKLVNKQEAAEGEKVTYTVRITNSGNLAKTVTLRDTLPEGLTFDNNTQIKVGNTGTVYTEQNLKNGIQVEVPEYSTVDVVFAGIVASLPNGEYTKELKNTATLDNEPTNEVTTNVTKANITAHKESDPASGTKVREGDTITYRIRVRNDGTRSGTVIVKDKLPAGTTFVEGSVKVEDVEYPEMTADNLSQGISVTVGIGEEKVVEFKVTVNKLIDGTIIKNTAYTTEVDEDGTPTGQEEKVPEEPEHTYVEPKDEQSISKDGTGKVDSLDQEITYNISYTAEISDYEGNATIKLIDTLPYAIDEAKSDLDGGTYDEESKTITWEQEVNDIQMTTTKEVQIDKNIKVVYIGISQETVSIENVVKGHIEYETPERTSEEVTANKTTTTGFVINIPVSKVWDDSDNKLGQRPTRVVFKLNGSDGSERTLELAKPGTQGTTTTLDSDNPNKWNDLFKDLPKYDSSNKEIVYTLTEEEKTEGDLKYYDSVVDDVSKTVTNTNKYGKVTVHHYIMKPDGTTTTDKVPDADGSEVPDEVIEGKEGDPYTTEPADNVNDKYELVQEKLPENPDGTIEKYDEEKPQEVIYYYRLKPAKVIIHYLEKDEDSDDSNNVVLSANEQIDGYVDDQYNTDTEHKKDTISYNGKTYTLVSNSGNTTGTMTVADTNVTYYYLQNTKATVRYVARDPVTHEEIEDLETPYTKEGLVGDEFVTNSKDFVGYKLVESPEKTTIKMTKEEQTLIYYYEPVYTGLLENHIDDKTGKILYTEEHSVQVGQSYDIPSKAFEGYDLVTSKLPNNASGTMGEEFVTVNYYYIKKAVLEVHYIDKTTGEELTNPVIDDTKHEGDSYTTEQKTFEDYDLVEVPSNAEGTLTVETDEYGNITNNKTVVTYYYVKKSAGVEEHHIDIQTGEELEPPTMHEGHVGEQYNIKSKDFLSYVVATTDKDGNDLLPTNATGTMTEDKIVVTYYYYQPAKVIVHYVDKTTGKEIEETNPETGELQSSQVVIEGQKDDEFTTEAKEFEYYELVEIPEEPNGTMKVEITKDENGNDVVNNTIDVYYYYEPKPFNIGVEKEITGIIVNGNRRSATNGKLEKVDIYRKSTENTSVQVEYKIKVMNTGEVKGRAIIEDKLPEGMSLANNDGTWEVNNGTLTKVIPEIGAGETKEYTVLLNWNTSGANMGNKINEVSLIQTDNVPGFKDNNDKDNTDQATVSISVETGELPVGLLIALVGLVALESVTLRYAVVLTKRQKKSNTKAQKKENKK